MSSPRPLSAVTDQTAPSAHGFYTRTLIDAAFNSVIRVRRYLCQACRRTSPCCPTSSCPIWQSSLMVIALFLIARLPRANHRGRRPHRTAAHALPARPVSDSPLPHTGPIVVRRTGRADSAHSRARLRPPRSDHARIHRLGRRSSLPVCRRALPPAGLAARSGSRRPPRRILFRRSTRLSLPTHHLHGTAPPSSVSCRPEKNTRWTTRPKKSRCFAPASSRPWCWRRCPAAN